MKRLLVGAALLLALGCDHLLDHRAPAVYAPWEEGLTLAFTDPSKPSAPRLQMRVKKLEETPAGKLVREAYTSLSGETEVSLRLEKGGLIMVLDPSTEIMILPEGFPDQVSRWVVHGVVNTVIGRARVDLPGVKLPDPEAIGIWVESAHPSGARTRTLFVPDFGDVETLNFDKGKGQWVAVNRMVSQGFTVSGQRWELPMSEESKEVQALPAGVAKGAVRDNLEVVLFAVLLIVFFKTFVGQQFTIPSASMRNTLMIGDHVLVNKFIFAKPQWAWEEKLFPMRKPSRGDIIVFRYPLERNSDYVKRLVALPGDTLEVRDKRLYVNNKLVTGTFEHHVLDRKEGPVQGPWPLGRNPGVYDDPPATELWRYADPDVLAMDQQGQEMLGGGYRDNFGPITVPKDHIFAMGDNRDSSADSRYWGFVPSDHLRGRPFIIWWSFREGGNDDTNANVPKGPTDVLMNFVDGARHFLSWTRWERTGTIPR